MVAYGLTITSMRLRSMGASSAKASPRAASDETEAAGTNTGTPGTAAGHTSFTGGRRGVRDHPVGGADNPTSDMPGGTN